MRRTITFDPVPPIAFIAMLVMLFSYDNIEAAIVLAALPNVLSFKLRWS